MIIIAVNGHLWISRSVPDDWKKEEDERQQGGLFVCFIFQPYFQPSFFWIVVAGEEMIEGLQRLKTRHAETSYSTQDRLNVIRVRNSINILRLFFNLFALLIFDY